MFYGDQGAVVFEFFASEQNNEKAVLKSNAHVGFLSRLWAWASPISHPVTLTNEPMEVGLHSDEAETDFNLHNFSVESDLKRKEYSHDSELGSHFVEHPSKKRVIREPEQEAAEAIGAIVNSVDMMPVPLNVPVDLDDHHDHQHEHRHDHEHDHDHEHAHQHAHQHRSLEVLGHHSLHESLDSSRMSQHSHVPDHILIMAPQHQSNRITNPHEMLVHQVQDDILNVHSEKHDTERIKSKLCNFGKFGDAPCPNPKLAKFPQCKDHYNLLQRVRRTYHIKEEDVTLEMINRCKNPKISGQKRSEKIIESADGQQKLFYCRKCCGWKPQELFHKDSRSFSGRQSICKSCKGAYNGPKPQVKGSEFFNYLYQQSLKDDRKRNRLILDGQHPITPQFIEQVASSQGHRCYFTRTPLSYSLSARANQACLDRPFWKSAFSQGNVRLVCLPLYKIRSIASDDQIEQLLHECATVELNEDWIPWTIPELTDPVIMVLNSITRKIWSKIGKDPLNNLNSSDIHGMILSHINTQKNRCRFSGLTFDWDLRSLKRPHLDRISPKRQYTIENTQLVIYPIILMKRNLTEQDLLEFFNERKKQRVEDAPIELPSAWQSSSNPSMNHLLNMGQGLTQSHTGHLGVTITNLANMMVNSQNRVYQMSSDMPNL